MFLVDTNIFLEILLNQTQKKQCKVFLSSNKNKISLSDFSLHSIGVILFRQEKANVYSSFLQDVLPRVSLLSLTIQDYEKIVATSTKFHLDFDDAYQTVVAKTHNLQIVTMDNDFRKVEEYVTVRFL